MIVTEEEAKTKRCQESFGDGSVTPSGHMVAVHMTAGAGYAIGTSPSMCIGSACMAWRQMPLIENGSLHEIVGPRKGFCGKAGNP